MLKILAKTLRPAGLFLLATALLSNGPAARAQALPTASRLADVQGGATFSFAKPDYFVNNLHGYGFYGDIDFRARIGLEVDFHELSGPNPILYERAYEIGPRFLYPIHDRFIPYAKAMYGRGVFNFPSDNTPQAVQIANLAYNIASLGGGLDIKARRGLNIRVFDYEYQRWPNFPPLGLTPQVLSFGVAYHFHGNLTR